MFLRYRPATLRDLGECQSCLRDSFAFDKTTRPALISLWRDLMQSDQGRAAVIEDISAASGSRILWFCFKVFASDEQAEYFKWEAPPFLGRNLMELHRQKLPLPLMTPDQLRKANAPNGSGVTMVVLNSGFAPSVLEDTEKMALISDKVIDFNCYFVAGYNLNEVLLELYDDFSFAWARGAGYHPRSDYSPYYERRDTHTELEKNCPRPQLWGVNREEGHQGIGTVAGIVFKYQTPQFYFRPADQEMLMWALASATDAELAEELCLSPNTIKRRWKTIYERVEMVNPTLFEHVFRTGESGSGERGSERRRHLLNYLKQHPEELRPLPKAKDQVSGASANKLRTKS
jgi:DNA-binding CsgD family transcriptional regulator